MPDSWDKVTRWRMRAEEIRAAADEFSVPSTRDQLRRLAQSYEVMAAKMEARLRGDESAESEEIT